MKNYIIASLIGLSLGIGSTASFIKYTQPEIKVGCPQAICPECEKCPPVIDFEKVKNFRGELNVRNSYTINTDSNFRALIIKDIEDLIKKQKLSRCK